jgi:hypothetical protein
MQKPAQSSGLMLVKDKILLSLIGFVGACCTHTYKSNQCHWPVDGVTSASQRELIPKSRLLLETLRLRSV